MNLRYELFKRCREGNIIEINDLIADNPEYHFDWDFGLNGASMSGNIDIINLMLNKGATCWNLVIDGASTYGHLELVKLAIQNGGNNIGQGFLVAGQAGQLHIIKYLLTTDIFLNSGNFEKNHFINSIMSHTIDGKIIHYLIENCFLQCNDITKECQKNSLKDIYYTLYNVVNQLNIRKILPWFDTDIIVNYCIHDYPSLLN